MLYIVSYAVSFFFSGNHY